MRRMTAGRRLHALSGLLRPLVGRMSQRSGKMLVPLLGLLTVLAIGVSAVAIVLEMKNREKLQVKERELHLALAENNDLKVQLEDTRKAKSRLEAEIGTIQQDAARSKEELVKFLQTQEELQRSVDNRQKEIDRLTQEISQAKSTTKEVTAQLSKLKAERDDARQQVARLEKDKQQLEGQLSHSSNEPTVELDKVMVTNDPFSASTGSSSSASSFVPAAASSAMAYGGQIVVVNREYDFVVMNLGKNHGLMVGQEFKITRGGELLGKARVEKVYDELSAAAIMPGSKKNSIKEGDSVTAL